MADSIRLAKRQQNLAKARKSGARLGFNRVAEFEQTSDSASGSGVMAYRADMHQARITESYKDRRLALTAIINLIF